MRLSKKGIVFLTLMILWMVLIFCLSAQNADESSQTSDSFIMKIVNILSPDKTEAEKETIVENWTHFVRKTAHFTAYMILGIFSSLFLHFSLKETKRKTAVRTAAAMIICILYSVSDEIHQRFVPGRSCEFRDVCIDSAGALLGTTAVLLAIILIKASRKKKEKRNER